MAPNLTQIAVAYDPGDTGMVGIYREPIEQGAARLSLGVAFVPFPGKSQIDTVIDGLGRQPNTGLISGLDAFTAEHRIQIIAAAARNRLPAIYAVRYWPLAGGLMSYGMDQPDMYRQLDIYVDLILRGAHPADLPVMAPRKWELVINKKTADQLGLTVSPTLLAIADEVIE
jgi:putative ABC transport system substrate-binding protein